MATHIKKIIENFIKEKKTDIKEKEKIRQIVDSVLDKKLKKDISLKTIYKNKLIFSSSSSHFSYEFSLKKGELLEALRKEFPQIEDIKIKVG